jgi:hypothetical protein
MEYPLKYKYRSPKPRGRYHSGYGGNNSKAKPHRQLSQAELARHAAQPHMIRIVLPSGKSRMVRMQDYDAVRAAI